jgi:hypothetical protein
MNAERRKSDRRKKDCGCEDTFQRDLLAHVSKIEKAQDRDHNAFHRLENKIDAFIATLEERCPQRKAEIEGVKVELANYEEEVRGRMVKQDERITIVEKDKHKAVGALIIISAVVGYAASWFRKQIGG